MLAGDRGQAMTAHRILEIALAGVIACSAASPALAQQSASTSNRDEDPELADIVVTADRSDSFSADFVQAGTFRNGLQIDTPLTISVIPEQLLSGVSSGMRYARHSPAMRALIVRSIAFTACASAFWALLPVIARDQLGLGAGGFGSMSAAFGIGAVIGAFMVPGQLRRHSLNKVVAFGSLVWVMAGTMLAATTLPFHAFLGVAIMSIEPDGAGLIAPDHYLALHTLEEAVFQQQLGGGLLWASGDVVGLLFTFVMLFQWMRASEREAVREDRRLDRLEAAGT